PGHEVFELRELHLQLAFARARAPGEDVENQLRPIDDRASERFLEIPQLRRRQLVVEDDEVGACLDARGRERLDLSAAEERRRIGLRALLLHAQHDVGAGGRRQAGELVERMFGIEVPRRVLEETDERRAFACHCSDLSTLSQGTTPCRTSVTGDIEASTMVDGAPPRAAPPSTIASTSDSDAATASALDEAGVPERFALVAVMAKPAPRASAIATAWPGMRIPTVCPPPRP